MDLKEAIHARRSVREFTNEPIDQRIIRQLIDAAIQAPSAVNEQPWRFSVVRDKAVLARISKEAKAYMRRTPPAGIALHHLEELLNDPEYDILYHAPALVVISAIRDQWTVENSSLAAENLMLAASATGLGTCWVGFAQAWLGTPEGKKAIELPENYVPVAPIIIGHPKSQPAPIPRNEPQITWIGS